MSVVESSTGQLSSTTLSRHVVLSCVSCVEEVQTSLSVNWLPGDAILTLRVSPTWTGFGLSENIGKSIHCSCKHWEIWISYQCVMWLYTPFFIYLFPVVRLWSSWLKAETLNSRPQAFKRISVRKSLPDIVCVNVLSVKYCTSVLCTLDICVMLNVMYANKNILGNFIFCESSCAKNPHYIKVHVHV